MSKIEVGARVEVIDPLGKIRNEQPYYAKWIGFQSVVTKGPQSCCCGCDSRIFDLAGMPVPVEQDFLKRLPDDPDVREMIEEQVEIGCGH